MNVEDTKTGRLTSAGNPKNSLPFEVYPLALIGAGIVGLAPTLVDGVAFMLRRCWP